MIEARAVNPYQGSLQKRTEQQPAYDERQLTAYSRSFSGIKAHRIIRVEGKKLTIPLPSAFSGRTATFELNQRFDPENHVEGKYIDVILTYTSYQGRASGYRLTYIGITPPKFIPTSGENIG